MKESGFNPSGNKEADEDYHGDMFLFCFHRQQLAKRQEQKKRTVIKIQKEGKKDGNKDEKERKKERRK